MINWQEEDEGLSQPQVLILWVKNHNEKVGVFQAYIVVAAKIKHAYFVSFV